MGYMRTPIIGRPQRLTDHRRAALYTLDCKESVHLLPNVHQGHAATVS
jgi:hypothetical protein